MKNLKNLIYYVATIGGLSLLMYFIIIKGAKQEKGKIIGYTPTLEASTWSQFRDTFAHNISHPLAILLLQIVTIIIVARVFGYLCRKIRQPVVIGEIIAGILLGPSFLGMYFPEFSSVIFPEQSLSNLKFLSQIGLILFMFIIGMELDLKILKNQAKEAVIISHASIIFPFSLGVGLAYYLYSTYSPDNINFLSFSLFIGIAMSITAFPVLARIIQEKGITRTKLGSIALTCAAADDITAWCMLAVVIAIVKAGAIIGALFTVLMALFYVFFMLKLVRPFLKKFGDKYSSREGLSKPVVGIFFIVMLLSAYLTEVIGIHALFGAFMAGICMPSNVNFRVIFIEKLEDVSLVLLLPLFFVYTGLRTQIGLLADAHLWGICGIIICVAVTGKFAGGALSAKFVGQTWRDSLIIGALMNTRGLVELVVLNIGYDLGVLTPQVFAMFVIMALFTTFMTAPVYEFINWSFPDRTARPDLGSQEKYNVLVSFGSPQKGVPLIKVASGLVKKSPEKSGITALHLSPSTEINQFNLQEYEKESFRQVRQEAKKLGQIVTTVFKPSQDIHAEIIQTVNQGGFDLLLIGIGTSVFEGTVLGRFIGFTSRIINPERLIQTIKGREKFFEPVLLDEKVKQILRASKVPVGILVDKKLDRLNNIFVAMGSVNDVFLLDYAKKLIVNANSRVTIADMEGAIKKEGMLQEVVHSFIANNTEAILTAETISRDLMNKHDLLIISLENWKALLETADEWLTYTPSVLIVRP
jgi:Kef-type K+ transport system membrane component KefB